MREIIRKTYFPNLDLAAAGLVQAGLQHEVNVVTGFGPEAGAALTAHPGVDKIARVTGEQIANVPSSDMDETIWRKLLARVLAAFAACKELGVTSVAMAGLGKAGKPPGCAPSALTPTVNVEVVLGDLTLRVFSLLSTFGTAQDVTTDELRIETFFPADEVTAAFFQSMAADGG